MSMLETLPGILQQQGAAAGGGITFVDSGQDTQVDNTNCSVSKFAGLADDDVLIGFWAKTDDDGSATGVVAGWTTQESKADQGGAPDRQVDLFYKVVTSAAGEPSAWTITHNGVTTTDDHSLIVLAYRGVDTTTPIDAANSFGPSTNKANPIIADLTTITNNALVLACAITAGISSFTSFDSTDQGTFVETVAVGINSSNMGIASFTQVTAGATGATTFTCTANGGSDWTEKHIALRPA